MSWSILRSMAGRRLLSKAKWTAFGLIEKTLVWGSTFEPGPVLDQSEFPWVAEVEAATPAIREELFAVQATDDIPNFQDISVEQTFLTQDDRWKTFFFYGYGHQDSINSAKCPATTDALGKIPGVKTAMFSILAPGKHIPPHRGPYNGVLRYHLGLVVPDDGTTSGIRVDDQTRHWKEGGSLLFDDSYDHQAWNDSDQTRVVLFVDFVRPTRFPVNVLNAIILWIISRSQFVLRGRDNLRAHHRTNGQELPETPTGLVDTIRSKLPVLSGRS